MGLRGPKPLPASELAKRGSHRAARRAAEESGALSSPLAGHAAPPPVAPKESGPRAPLPGDEFAAGDPRRDSLETWLPLLLLLPKFDPRRQAAGYRFDGVKARHVIDWFEEHVRHLIGARRGELVRLDPWQRAFLANLFGWVHDGGPRDGRRRFRKAILYIAKKNGKTTLLGGLAAYCFTELGEGGAKVLTAATHRGQAKGVWSIARDTIAADPPTLAKCILWNATIQLVSDPTAVLAPISGEAKGEDGADCSVAILDELHRQSDTNLLTVLESGGAAREEPLFIILTTADEIRESPCNAERAYAVSVRDNPGDQGSPGWNPAYLPAVYELDEGDEWRDEANWYKANPGLGTIKSLDTMRSLFREANERADARIPFQRFNLNLRVQNVLAPIKAAKWAECRGTDDWRVLREKVRGRPCYLGVDLAETNDMVGLVAWFPEERVVLPWYWGCERAASDRFKRNEPVYYRWRDAGALELVSDDAIELAPIVAKVEELKSTYKILGMGVDRAKALEFTFAVQKFGIAATFVGQGYLTMTEPCDRLVAMVENRRFVHGGHPVLNWNAENLRFKVTGQRAKQPQKPTEAQKIDGIAAWLTAMALTMGEAVANAKPASVYESRDLMTF